MARMIEESIDSEPARDRVKVLDEVIALERRVLAEARQLVAATRDEVQEAVQLTNIDVLEQCINELEALTARWRRD
jgi:hypothetical protein